MNNFEIYENLTSFRKPLITQIIDSIEIKPDSKGMDLGCGIGAITQLLYLKKGVKNSVIGLDYSKEFIDYAQKNSKNSYTQFIQGDVNHLDFKPHSFDWIWSMDTIWPGPKELGCPAETPHEILQKLYEILKPNGKLYLVYWSGQKFLSGYPILEAQLNASPSANAPFYEQTPPENHIMNATAWLKQAGFKDIKAKSFVGNISAPLSDAEKKSLHSFFEMLWGESNKDLKDTDRKIYNQLTSADSDKYILGNPSYYGYYIYTLFEASK
jgi:demethylmenaquinone methyltransferase/2-methoxy-6-polyprenyl-1,4-benzoquinol methylase